MSENIFRGNCAIEDALQNIFWHLARTKNHEFFYIFIQILNYNFNSPLKNINTKVKTTKINLKISHDQTKSTENYNKQHNQSKNAIKKNKNKKD